MAWTKSPKSLVDLFEVSLPESPGLQRRQMFGYPVAFVNGHMCAGLFQDTAFIRPPPAARAELEAEGARPFEPMAGRPLRDYLTLPETVMEDEERFGAFVSVACAFTAGLPPKPPKAKKNTVRSSRS